MGAEGESVLFERRAGRGRVKGLGRWEELDEGGAVQMALVSAFARASECRCFSCGYPMYSMLLLISLEWLRSCIAFLIHVFDMRPMHSLP